LGDPKLKLNFSKNDGFYSCALCDNKIVFINPDKTMNTENYREVAFLISNNSLMNVGFCPDCEAKARTDKSLFDAIIESVKDGWLQEMVHDKWPEDQKLRYSHNFFNLKILDWYHGKTA
jgi:hypothetical protein